MAVALRERQLVQPTFQTLDLSFARQPRLEMPSYSEALALVAPEIQESIDTLFDIQSPAGLFPATHPEFFVHGNDMNLSWGRDGAEITRRLLYTVQHFPLEANDHNKALEMVDRGINGQLALYSQEPWKSAFGQDMMVLRDGDVKYTVLTQEAPPIQQTIHGTPHVVNQPDQPDTFGFFAITAAAGIRAGIVGLNDETKSTLANMANYLVNRRVDMGEFSSMWENSPGRTPAASSTVRVVRSGLRDIRPFVEGFWFNGHRIEDKIYYNTQQADDFLTKHGITDYTNFTGHESRSDLATVIALAADRVLDPVSYKQFYRLSSIELNNGARPGIKRHVGDWYTGMPGEEFGGEERYWPIGRAVHAVMCFRMAEHEDVTGRPQLAQRYRELGAKHYLQALDLKNAVGYHPELVRRIGNDTFVPNRPLPWHAALMMEAGTRFVQASAKRAA